MIEESPIRVIAAKVCLVPNNYRRVKKQKSLKSAGLNFFVRNKI
jgi:hypothetical protein